MAKDAITMFKEAAAQLQREEAYLALEGTRKKKMTRMRRFSS